MDIKTKVFLKQVGENWVLISTAFVALSIGVGLFYSSSYFREFGIDYLHFADFSDLVKLPFLSETFFISLMLFLALVIVPPLFIQSVESKEIPKKEIGLRAKVSSYVFVALALPFVLMIFLGPIFTPYFDASSVKRGSTTLFKVSYGKGDDELKCASIIGTSDKNYIFWNYSVSSSVVIPKSQIIELVLIFRELSNAKQGNEPDGLIQTFNQRLEKINAYCK